MSARFVAGAGKPRLPEGGTETRLLESGLMDIEKLPDGVHIRKRWFTPLFLFLLPILGPGSLAFPLALAGFFALWRQGRLAPLGGNGFDFWMGCLGAALLSFACIYALLAVLLNHDHLVVQDGKMKEWAAPMTFWGPRTWTLAFVSNLRMESRERKGISRFHLEFEYEGKTVRLLIASNLSDCHAVLDALRPYLN